MLMVLENNSFPDDVRVMLEATSLVQDGFEVTVVCPTDGHRRIVDAYQGVRILRYPSIWQLPGGIGHVIEFGYSLIAAGFCSLYVLLRHGFDAIHIHCPPDTNALLGIVYRWLGKTFVYDMHDLSPELYKAQRGGGGAASVVRSLRWFERLACRSADRLIATNATQRDVQIRRGGAPDYRCYIVRNGPNEQFLTDQPDGRSSSSSEIMTIGYVGLISPQDGVDRLIYALHELRETFGFHAFRASIVGDGPALPALRALTRQLNLEQHVDFVGRIPFEQVPAHIASADICVTPDPINDYNNSCTTIKTMEYMALRKPVVMFGTTENVATAGDGALVASEDTPQALAQGILRLAKDPELRRALGERGRQRVEAGLGWTAQATVLVDLYRELARRSHRRCKDASSWSGSRACRTPRISAGTQSGRPVVGCTPAFPGRIGECLVQHIARDMRDAQLSLKFRIYYCLRPLIPIALRQWLQRNQYGQRAKDDWSIPVDWATEFAACVRQQIDADPGFRVIAPWPDDAQSAIVLTHDVETREGFDRVLDIAAMEEKHGLRSAWNIVPHKYRLDQGVLRELRRRGHEVGVHGWSHDGRLFSSRRTFRLRADRINQVLSDWDAAGFRAPMVHRNLAWLQDLNLRYDASCFDVDPYQAMPGGIGGPWPFLLGRIVELPYTLPQDHTLDRLGMDWIETWQRKLDYLLNARGLVLSITHPDYMDTVSKRQAYDRWLAILGELPHVWRGLPGELAQWWRDRAASQVPDDPVVDRPIGPASERGRIVPAAELFADFLARWS
ncbi:MAG: glycosyltransferase [Planctomycetota bacterium]|nr:MAG: glycosyltransferase [Planctomycetota bacterium]